MESSGQTRLPCAIELALGFFFLHFLIWVVTPQVADGSRLWTAIFLVLCAAAGLWILVLSPRLNHTIAHSLRGAGHWKTLFLRPEGLGRAVRDYALITALGLVVIIGVRLARHPAAFPVLTWKLVTVRFVSYIASGLLQASIIFEFFQPRFRALYGDRAAIWGTAVFFSLFHIPSLLLMGLGLGIAYLWAREDLIRPNLVLVALSHATLGSALALVAGVVPRIGPFYLHPNMYVIRTLLPWWKDLVSGLW